VLVCVDDIPPEESVTFVASVSKVEFVVVVVPVLE